GAGRRATNLVVGRSLAPRIAGFLAATEWCRLAPATTGGQWPGRYLWGQVAAIGQSRPDERRRPLRRRRRRKPALAWRLAENHEPAAERPAGKGPRPEQSVRPPPVPRTVCSWPT